VTVGSGVDEEERYSDVLQGLMNEHSAPARFEVINTGIGGLNINQAINRLERASGYYRFHLAVYGWTINDIEGASYVKVDQSEGWRRYWRESRRFQRSPFYLLRVLWPRWLSLRERMWPVHGDRYHEVLWNYFENPKAWADFEAGLDRLAEFAGERGICSHLFLHTHLSELNAEHRLRDLYDRIAHAAKERGISVTQSLPTFLGRSEWDLWVGPFDPHPNAKGHALLAQSLRDGLTSDLPAECWHARLDRWPPPKAPSRGR